MSQQKCKKMQVIETAWNLSVIKQINNVAHNLDTIYGPLGISLQPFRPYVCLIPKHWTFHQKNYNSDHHNQWPLK